MNRRAPDRNHDTGVPYCPQKPAALFQNRRSRPRLFRSPVSAPGRRRSSAGRSAVTLSIARWPS